MTLWVFSEAYADGLTYGDDYADAVATYCAAGNATPGNQLGHASPEAVAGMPTRPRCPWSRSSDRRAWWAGFDDALARAGADHDAQ